MPTYDYICQSCKYEFEEMQKISASPLQFCPQCANNTLKRKVGGGIGLNFIGSGYYCTDYASSPKAETAPAPSTPCCPCGKNNPCK